MPSRTLYLHIGCHKTGTTSIQRTLQANEKTLAQHNLVFFYNNRESGERKLPDLHSWLGFDHDRGLVPDGMRIKGPKELANQLSQLPGDVVVSSENFSFIFDPKEISRLKNALSKVFDDIKVICYIRRQDQHIVSHHQEGSKVSRRAENDLFGHTPHAIPPFQEHHALYLDYHQRLGFWGDIFGDENLVIRVFDRVLLKNGDAVADFFELLGIETFEKIKEHNVSVSGLEAKIGHIINSSQVENKQWLARMLKPRLAGGDKLSPSRAIAREYLAHYADSNISLNQRFGISPNPEIFSDDFSMYPEEDNDQWDDASAADALAKVLEIVDNVYGSLSTDEIRDAAVALEKRKPELSYKLMSVAAKLRPEGRFIQRKLAHYQAVLTEKEK